MKKNKKVKKVIGIKANFIIEILKKEGIIIQRYDSYTTNSIYLKLDYGVINTIRISDHKGKKHLSYRYNLLTCCPKIFRSKDSENLIRYYFPIDDEKILIRKILFDRWRKINQYGLDSYIVFMRLNKQNGMEQWKGFWEKARVV